MNRIGNFLIKYWKEFLFFGLIFSIYTVCTSPGYTWACLDNDCFNFVHAAKFIGTPHVPGYPLQTIISLAIINIPIGMEGWRLAWFLSAIPSLISCILVFVIVKKLTNNLWSPWIATVALAGNNVFLAQSIIPEIYIFSITCMLATYWAFINKKEIWTASLAGFTAGTHPFLFFPVALMTFWGVKKRWWWIPVVISVGLYSYCLLRNDVFLGFTPYALELFWGDYGNLALSQFMYRLRDTGIILCVGFGLTLIPASLYLADIKQSWRYWLFLIIPLFYWFTNNTEVTYVHFLLIFPWIAISAGLGLDKIKIKPALIFAVSLILLLIMPFFYDIGNNMDEDLSAQKFYDDLKTVPDGSIITDIIFIEGSQITGADERTMVAVWIANKENDHQLVDLNIAKYLNYGELGEAYRSDLRDKGLNTPVFAILTINGRPNMPLIEAPLYGFLMEIKKANPDRRIYYTLIPERKPMNRILMELK